MMMMMMITHYAMSEATNSVAAKLKN